MFATSFSPTVWKQSVPLASARLIESWCDARWKSWSFSHTARHPNTLSGGQKQRLAVAVSMICEKDLLVFDEPTSGLDFDSMTQVAGLIRRLSDMGKIIFVVTHDFEFVCRTCSRVLHFDEGEMPDDVPVTIDALPKLRALFSVEGNDQEAISCLDGKKR